MQRNVITILCIKNIASYLRLMVHLNIDKELFTKGHFNTQ